ncbi:ethanolamine ammonia-lyase subunit EutC [Acinetobacter sp. ANC 3813]|uniref:ethanolamine ammonia-lyase subunit EutC n=1 Tax=Acinetobacter sp. ANC 3813 TaxID=1977873 RepID=UPI000A3476AB|nr:ethanolamine ammonia-lyase subunit EutC [Acinetobacter sp. ANC 3813]OTG90583.1 ethanolamine ammonia-lyase [Acinetobacter sp. ANC 3813]
MKLHPDVQFKTQHAGNAWEQLKQFTDARIALGRAGGSLPTRPALEFQLAHAQAKDAVLKELDLDAMQSQLSLLQHDTLQIESCAVDKDMYLKRPDLGRELSDASRQQLQDYAQQHPAAYDLVIVAGDGLSARAIEDNAPYFIQQLHAACTAQSWTLAPIVLAAGSRVALGDEIAQLLNAKMLVMLIGERPGLSSPDSMGIYYTWQAHKGCHDAMRNCISNVRPAGLSAQVALQRLVALMKKSAELGYSGVNLKDEHEIAAIVQAPNRPKQLF